MSTFCFYKKAGYGLTDFKEDEYISKETVFKVLNELSRFGVKAVEWTGGGSVECHPNYREIFKYANDLGIKQSLVTNGTLLDDTDIELIKDFEWVRFSIDAASPEIWTKVKGVDAEDGYSTAIENIADLISKKKETNVVGFSFVVCKENYKEIVSAAKLAKSIGCNNIRFSLALTPDGDKLFEGIWEECSDLITEAQKLKDDNFQVFSFANRINTLRCQEYSEYCGYHHFVGVISPSGVYPCCRLKDDARFNLGDLNKESFADIWFGEKRVNFIKSIEEGCPFDCWMTDKNNFIQYLMDEDPMHKEFI